MTPCDQGELGAGSIQEPEDKPPSLGKVTGEEEKRRRKEKKRAEEGNKESVEEENSNFPSSLDAESQPSTSFSSATGTVESEREEEQPGRQLKCLEIPDFLLSDAPEDNTGNHSICQIILMAYVFFC